MMAAKARLREQRAATAAAKKAAKSSIAPADRRRSDRSQGKEAPNYNDNENSRVLALADGEGGGSRDRRLIKENINQEIYTMEHVNALGSHEKEWELFVDGYDSEGNRIYDKEVGKTCHQCRQKTLGIRTTCSECGDRCLQGQFCGDCLFMRYGENIEEANANPDWKCPECRGICNCSFHRSKLGWAPTGTMFRSAAADGFKSVAHALVLTNLAPEAKPLALHLMPEEYRAEVEAEIAAEKEKPAKKTEDKKEASPSSEDSTITVADVAAIEDAIIVLDQKRITRQDKRKVVVNVLTKAAPKRKGGKVVEAEEGGCKRRGLMGLRRSGRVVA
jgi:cell division cycle-associated protein 7